MSIGNASVTSSTGNVAGTTAISGNTMIVHLTGVANAQTLSVTLNALTDQFLQNLPDTAASMSVLIGDVNGNALVNATDVSAAKAQSGALVSNANFHTEIYWIGLKHGAAGSRNKNEALRVRPVDRLGS